MSRRTIKMPRVADPTIEQVLDEFLAEQRKRLKPRTMSGYEDVIRLLTDFLNNYAYEALSKAETALFDRHYNADGKDHREFCELFGPDKIIEELGGFLGYFMTRKVMAGGDFKRMAGTVVKKLSKWLAEKGYVSKEDALEGIEDGACAARDLPKAERAAHILYEASDNIALDPNELGEDDYLNFGHYTIKKVEPEKLWLEIYGGGKRIKGPIPVPKKASDLLQEGWEISCALARIRGKWRIVEMANVYPL